MPAINIETLTLPGVLAIAVVALWRKLDQKDATIAEALKILERSAEANEAVAEAMERLRASLPRARKSQEP